MTASAARGEPERMRLWAASALIAVLAHAGVTALLYVHLPWRPPPPLPASGSPTAVDIELGSPTPSPLAPPPDATPEQSRPIVSSSASRVPDIESLSRLQPMTAQLEPTQPATSPVAPASSATNPSETRAVLAPLDLTAVRQNQGQRDIPPSPEQLWIAQIRAQLQRYEQYPANAVKKHQQDTVMLRLSTDQAGHVVYSRIYSAHHYAALEREVDRMLRLAGTLPPPPEELSVEKGAESTDVSIPVSFSLIYRAPSAAPAACVKPADPGSVPTGTVATLEQMRTYRARLDAYIGATRSELGCLGHSEAAAGQRSAIAGQLQAMVNRFNEQARVFQVKAEADALLAQQARARAAQAFAAQAYADCSSPMPPRSVRKALTAPQAPIYRRQLLGYDRAVRAYVACIRQSQQLAVTRTGTPLTAEQGAALERRATQLANAVVLPFNRLVLQFNTQLDSLQQQTGAARALAQRAALARVQAAFASSTWDIPAPLPPGECIRILRSTSSYQAQLCRDSYIATVPMHAFPRAGRPAVLGIDGVQPNPDSADAANAPAHTISYSINELQMASDRIVMTISRRLDIDSSAPRGWTTIHFDLVLSADGRSLQGRCWTEQKHWDCQLPRHH